jgi:hypothetical protein
MLEELIITDNVVKVKTADWLLQVSMNKVKYFPSLHKISCYHGVPIQNEPVLLQPLQAAGVEYFDHILDYPHSLGEEFWHPWCYTPEQLDALAQAEVKARDERYMAEYTMHLLLENRRHYRLFLKGLVAVRHLMPAGDD